MALVTILFFAFFIILVYLLYYLTYKSTSRIVVASLITTLVFILLLGCLLYDSLSKLSKISNYDELGPFGDYIGGLVNPLISVFAVIAAGFAFYAQYEANKQVQEQFKIQQFENRLFKMLDIYSTNVSSLKFITRKRGNLFEGKMVFPYLISNFNQLKKDVKFFLKKKDLLIDELISEKYKNELIKKNIYSYNFILIEVSYIIFLYGVGVNGRKNIKALLSNKYNLIFLKELLNYLSNKPIEYDQKHKNLIEEWKKIFVSFESFDKPNNKKFDKYYNGHQNNLSHYYRHLFMIIKYIDGQNFLNYNKKWEYSKLIRTQLSNHEQELFFINSITCLGREWELNYIDENKRLITKYDLIKNISKAIRDKYCIENFYPNVVYEDLAKNTLHRDNFEKNIYK